MHTIRVLYIMDHRWHCMDDNVPGAWIMCACALLHSTDRLRFIRTQLLTFCEFLKDLLTPRVPLCTRTKILLSNLLAGTLFGILSFRPMCSLAKV